MRKKIETSLGYQLYKNKKNWEINLSDLKVFKGLSILARVLGDLIIEKVENSPGDISVYYKINPNINPELLEMKLEAIQIYAKSGVMDNIHFYQSEFHNQIRSVFGAIQRPKWGSMIHPEHYRTENETKALIFPFHHIYEGNDIDYIFILEKVKMKSDPKRFFLRLTIEDHEEATYHLKSIPFSLVDDLKYRVFIEGSTKMAESLCETLQKNTSKGLYEYSEENLISTHVFEQIFKTGIGPLDQMNIFWDDRFSNHLLDKELNENISFIKKVFLSLEDTTITRILMRGKSVRLINNDFFIILYLTRMNKVLNISINKERKSTSLEYYLKRMPLLESVARSEENKLDFSNTRIFLIHHITSEILALIEAFRLLKADSLNVMFVKYGGVIPSTYLDVLLEMASEDLFFSGLTRTITPDKKEYFVLSHLYGEIKNHREIADHLEKEKLNFYEAMKTLSGYFFLLFCEKAKKENRKVILIEDGGYLSPALNEYCLTKTGMKKVFEDFCLPDREDGDFSDWLDSVLIGTVEHTRNGFDRLETVRNNFQKMHLPAYSIAISKNKVEEESQEVAHSILSALESILHGQGMVLSHRKTIVLGSAGNIGSFVCKFMEKGRLHSTNKKLIKVDIKYSDSGNTDYKFKSISEIPDEDFLDRELFIGVIGKSILTEELLSKLIVNGSSKRLIFVSGSTKTVEFSDLRNFLNKLSMMASPEINSIPIKIHFDRIIDPQTKSDQGGLVTISFTRDTLQIEKTLYLTSDLSPLNFLFYGVPTETMDMIIRQLTTVSLGMVNQFNQSVLPPPGIYAVDKEIDEWGKKLI